MRRGRLDQAAEVMSEIIKRPKRSPSRILAGLGINYIFLRTLLAAGLVQEYKEKKRRRLTLTKEGREFLNSYQNCIRLFPS
jgi:predicted transcriptional regulator